LSFTIVNNSEMMDLRMMRVMGFPLGLLYSLKEGRKEGRKGSAREVQSSAHTNPAELCNWPTGSRRSEGASLSLEDAQDHCQNISRFEATETTDATLSHLKLGSIHYCVMVQLKVDRHKPAAHAAYLWLSAIS
jgi:hypothetical protein